MLYPDDRIMVFCKAPEPGKVKTRLAKSIGVEAAATVHEYLAWHCLKKIVDAHVAPVELWCAPDIEHDFFQRCATKFGVALRQQEGKCLGQRMQHAFSSALPQQRCSIVVGTDCPALNPDDLVAAFSELQHNDVVVGPAEDGGYVLLGMNRLQVQIFTDMPWGTSQVLAETLSRLKGDVKKMSTLWDVDHQEDLIRLRLLANELHLEQSFSDYLENIEL